MHNGSLIRCAFCYPLASSVQEPPSSHSDCWNHPILVTSEEACNTRVLLFHQRGFEEYGRQRLDRTCAGGDDVIVCYLIEIFKQVCKRNMVLLVRGLYDSSVLSSRILMSVKLSSSSTLVDDGHRGIPWTSSQIAYLSLFISSDRLSNILIYRLL